MTVVTVAERAAGQPDKNEGDGAGLVGHRWPRSPSSPQLVEQAPRGQYARRRMGRWESLLRFYLGGRWAR